MEHKVTGCNDCPMLHWDREEGIRCEHPESLDDNEIELNRQKNEIVLLTPDWCPLNESPITIIKTNQ